MSVASEITRIQNAKTSLKTSINAKTDSEHQITNETIDEYADFVDSIQTGGGGLDWSLLGYNGTPQSITDGYNYALQIKNNWTTGTSLSWKFSNDKNLVIFPLLDLTANNTMSYMCMSCSSLICVPSLDTKTITNFSNCFNACSALKDIPIFDFSSATNLSSMFINSYSLSDKSLDNLLLSCISVGSAYTSTKSLSTLGLNSSIRDTRIQALPHYQDFINAGWTIGY